MEKQNNAGAIASNAGDDFHLIWAGKKLLDILKPNSKLTPDLKIAVVQAVNAVFESKTQFMDILNRNIAVVMNQVDSREVELIERKLEQLQKELLKMANNNQDYSIIANEIYRLRDKKEAATF